MPPCTCTAVSQMSRVARAQYTFAIWAARIASAGRSSSTAQAAYRRTLTEPSIRARPSASGWATAW